MEIIIKKNADQQEIKSALKKMNFDEKKPKLNDFYGMMKDKFGDALIYQKKVRND